MADLLLSGLGWVASTVIGSAIGVGTSMYVKRIDRRAEVAKKRYEFAEEVLALFYEAEDAIRQIRSAFGWVGEGSSRPRADGETPEETEKLNRKYLINERIASRREVFSSLRAKKFRFQSMFRGEAHKPFEILEQSVARIASAYHMLVELEDSARDFHPLEANDVDQMTQRHNTRMKFSQTVWGSISGPDEIGDSIRSAILEIETIVDMTAREYFPASRSPVGSWFRRKGGV